MRRLATLTIIFGLSALLALTSLPGAALADTPDEDEATAEEDGKPSFTLSPVDSNRGYVEIDAEPGERLVLNLEIKNTGDEAGVARIFAADAITLQNGGYGARSYDAERTGPTNWLEFESEDIELEPDESVVRTVPVEVPDDVTPGEHMSSIVVQDRDPQGSSGEGSGIQLDQVTRQAVAILINIDGEREYGMELGEAEHRVGGQNSTARIEVANTGNTMIRPDQGEFRLEDDTGFVMLERDASMRVIYAGHDTHFALNLGERLEPGDYYVSLTLNDKERGVSASAERLHLHVEEPPEPDAADEGSGVTGLIQPPRMPGDDGSGSWWTLLGIVAVFSALAALIGVLVGKRRRAEAATVAATTHPAPEQPATQPNTAPAQSTSASTRSGGLKPLVPKDSDNRI